MIITEQKPEEEIKGYLEGISKVFIIGCGSCATKCETGGEEQVKAMAEKLRGWGVEVTGWAVPEECCDYRFLRRDVVRPHKEALEAADAVLVMACGSGVQAVAEVTGKL
ncbi:5,10-methylenetetrahydrofolate reductase, partial [Candidatus Bathyarchaeota archaeon]